MYISLLLLLWIINHFEFRLNPIIYILLKIFHHSSKVELIKLKTYQIKQHTFRQQKPYIKLQERKKRYTQSKQIINKHSKYRYTYIEIETLAFSMYQICTYTRLCNIYISSFKKYSWRRYLQSPPSPTDV